MADIPALPGEDQSEARARAVRNLRFIGWALHMFTRRNGGRLPSAAILGAGQPLLSWRVAILPWLEESALYKRFHLDEAWDSPHNQALLEEMPRVYAPVTREGATACETHYQGIVGPGSVFDGPEGTKIGEVVEVANPTLMVVEADEPVPWTKPADVPFDGRRPLAKLGGQFRDGFHVGLADGSVQFLDREIAPERLHALITRRRSA